jgi:hypothetical protein
MLSQDFREFVQLLAENKAEYLIHIWLNPVNENAGIIMKCVNEFGF